MSTLNLIAALVFICAITILFSQEIAGLLKKIFSIPGVKLILPLFLVSYPILYYQPWIAWWLLRLKQALHLFPLAAKQMFTYALTEPLTASLLMTSVCISPILFLRLRGKIITISSMQIAKVASAFIWLCLAILYSVHYTYFV